MRYPKNWVGNTKFKVIPFTGGVKEDIPQLGMKAGELLDSLNYQEIDGTYHGYVSLGGYEIFDGKVAPSAIGTENLIDHGIGISAMFLLESDLENPIKDAAKYNCQVVNTSVVNDPSALNKKFLQSSYYFNGLSNLALSPTSAGVLGEALDLKDYNFTIECIIKARDTFATQMFFEKGVSYRIYWDDERPTFEYSTDGIVWAASFQSDLRLEDNTEYHISIIRKNATMYMAIDGNKQANILNIGSDIIFTNTNDLTIGSSFIGWMDEIRLTRGYKWFYDFDTPTVPYSHTLYYTHQVDDEDREIQRALIEEVPGDGSILAVMASEDSVKAVRDLGPNSFIYTSSVSGWSSAAGGYILTSGGIYNHITSRYDLFVGLQRELVRFMVNGVNPPAYIDNAGNLVVINDIALPDQESTPVFATHIGDFKNRLWLAYPDGRLWYSGVGDPLKWDVATGGAGVIYIEDEITGLMTIPGDTMVVFCRNSIKLIKSLFDSEGTSSATQADYKFYVEEFSQRSGAIPNTIQRVLGKVYYLDDRGLTLLEATNTFANLSASVVSKNIQNTLLAHKAKVVSSLVKRENNQYRIFFEDMTGLIFTFDQKKKIKGITKIKYNHVVSCSDETEGTDGNINLFFGSDDGFIYQMDSGTSFNGKVIETRLVTSFHSYNSPIHWKRFRKVTLEAQADKGLIFHGRPDFNYKDPTIPRSIEEVYTSTGLGGTWGFDTWGLFYYGSGSIQSPALHLTGYGVNMSMSISTSDKYSGTHVLNNMITEFQNMSRKA